MKVDDLLKLLPSVPTLEELRTSDKAPGTKLSDEQFNAALRGDVKVSSSSITLPEIAETILNITSRDATPSLASGQVMRGTTATEGKSKIPESILNGYLWAAALRYTYSFDTLTPVNPSATDLIPRYQDLRPEDRDGVFAELTRRSEVISDTKNNIRWMLCNVERREALGGLMSSGRLNDAVKSAREAAAAENKLATTQAAATNVSPDESGEPAADECPDQRIEETLWAYLSEAPQSLNKVDRRQLLVTERVVTWLNGLNITGVPSLEHVATHLAKETLLQPFRHLTGEWKDGVFTSNFKGRESELSRLYDYLSVRPPESFSARLRRGYATIAESGWRVLNWQAGHRPCLIHGPGGVGKSTLLAKFLLDHLTERSPIDRFPYAYLDFDLSSLTAREPLTLLAEAARQLAAQYPSREQQWNEARTSWLQESRKDEPRKVDPRERRGAIERFVALLNESEREGHRVADLLSRGLPFLLVLDTFEEIQYRDRDSIRDVFKFLNIFREELPALRCIMMGRAPLNDVREEFAAVESVDVDEGDIFGTGSATNFDVIEVALGDLDKDSAVSYLRHEGIEDPELAEELVEIVGPNPLRLRLIIRVFKQGKLDITSLRKETDWRRGVGDWLRGRTVPPKALLQGVLFDRILGHIHNPQVRALAHPGLVLRRVTWELIKEVLAEPCGLKSITDEQAKEYYGLLAREVSLVGTDRDAQGGDVLRLRPELRRIVLRLMSADETKSEQIRQVHENAIKYYDQQSGLPAQVEALYHRLMIGQPPRPEYFLDDVPTDEGVDAGYVPRPTPDRDPRPVWRLLEDAIEDLPVPSVAYLSARRQQELMVEDSAWQLADPADWELNILGRASRRARERSNLITALEGIRHDRDRMLSSQDTSYALPPLSPLPLIEVALLERLGRYQEVLERSKVQLEQLHDQPRNSRRIVEFNLLAARAAARLHDAEGCERGLGTANQTLLEYSKLDLQQLDCCKRQLLRFQVDCFRLLPLPGTHDKLVRFLIDLLDQPTILRNAPTLTRYAVALAVSSPSHEPHPELTKKLLRLEVMANLLQRLPSKTIERIAPMVTKWTMNNPEGQIYNLLKPFGKTGAQETIDGIFRERLAGDPEKIAGIVLAFLFGPDRQQNMLDFCRELGPQFPVSSGSSDDDLFLEAKAMGEVMPGEGRLMREEQATQGAA